MEEAFPVERMSLSKDCNLLASIAHDESIKLWNVDFLFDEGDEGVQDAEKEAESDDDSDDEPAAKRKRTKGKGLDQVQAKKSNFFDDMM